ncbi:MAG: TlpA family protein disulfide reductase [Pseudomonadales bacterium]
MKTFFRFTALIFVAAILLATMPLSAIENIAVGERTNSLLTGTSLQGDPLRLTLSGVNQNHSATLLVFWASWCGVCVSEMPKLKELHASLAARVRFLGVNVNKNSADGRRLARQQSLPYPSFADPDLLIADRFKVRGTPTLLLFDQQGRQLARSNRLNNKFISALKKTY